MFHLDSFYILEMVLVFCTHMESTKRYGIGCPSPLCYCTMKPRCDFRVCRNLIDFINRKCFNAWVNFGEAKDVYPVQEVTKGSWVLTKQGSSHQSLPLLLSCLCWQWRWDSRLVRTGGDFQTENESWGLEWNVQSLLCSSLGSSTWVTSACRNK